MKNLKTILAALLVMVLVASCKKHETKPLVAQGQVTFEVIETDSLTKNTLKLIKYGYDNDCFHPCYQRYKVDIH